MNKKSELEEMVNDLYEKGTPPEIIQDLIIQNNLESVDVVGEDLTEEIIFNKELEDIIKEILDTFPDLEKQVIIYRYGLYGNDRLLRNEIAKKLNTTLERVRNAEDRAIKRFKHPINYLKIKDYLNNEKTYQAK